jgi:hypothetical protein
MFEIGQEFLATKMGHVVCSYNMERTICDVLRSRNRIDDQTVIAAVKNYVNRGDKNMNRLGEYASMFRLTKIVRSYFEVLL